jgi:arsenate reductase
MADKPSVLFVCVHNAGRSQMAAGYLNQLSGGRIRSAGSEPGDLINPVAVLAMAEEGIDIAAEQPKLLTTDAVKASDVVMGDATRIGNSTTPQAKTSSTSDQSATKSGDGSNA